MAKKSPKSGIQKAVEVAGGVRALSRLSGINKNVVGSMVADGVALPKHCISLHQLTGVPLHELNPEQYPAHLFRHCA